MKYPQGYIEETLRIIINNLNDDREHLSLQLGFAQGLITEDVYNNERAVYLIKSKFNHQDLIQRVRILKRLLGDRTDIEVIMTAFRCTLNEASEAFRDA